MARKNREKQNEEALKQFKEAEDRAKVQEAAKQQRSDAQKQHVLDVLRQQKRDREALTNQEKYEDRVYSQLEQQRLAKEDYQR